MALPVIGEDGGGGDDGGGVEGGGADGGEGGGLVTAGDCNRLVIARF